MKPGLASSIRGMEPALALVVAVALFIPAPVPTRASVGGFLAVFCLPLILPHVRVRRPAVVSLGAVLLTIAAALVTALFSVTLSGRAFSAPYFLTEAIAYFNMLTGLIAALWAAATNGVVRTATFLGVAGAVGGLIFMTPAQAENPWKYVLAWPVSLLVAALIDGLPVLVGVLAVFLLAGASLALESRNAAGSLVITGLLLLVLRWRWPGAGSVRRMVAARGAVIVAAAIGAFVAVTSLVGWGVFGQELAARQARQEGVWLLGGRVEPFATFGYFLHSPFGIGFGISPTAADRASALHWLVQSGSPSSTEYVLSRLLGAEVNLHSIVATLWYGAGFVGIVCAITLLVVVVRGVALCRRHFAIVAFLGCQAIWDLLFSPLDANGKWVGIAIALIVVATERRAGENLWKAGV